MRHEVKMSAGILLNATICFAITLSSFAFAWVLARDGKEHNEKSKPALWSLIVLWVLVGLTYLPTTVRMIAAYMGNQQLDLFMYYIAAVPFSFVAVPLVFFILYVIIGDQKISGVISALFVLFGAAYLALFFSSGVIGPTITPLTSLFTINSDIAINIYLIGLFVIPTAMIIGLLFLIFLQRMPKRLRYRTALPLVAISFVFDFMLTDMITLDDAMQLAARIFVLIGTVQAFLAYFPPLTLQERLGIQKYEYNLYEKEDEAEYDEDDEEEADTNV
jgi:MFS family permease